MSPRPPRVIVVGAGFGGLWALRGLRRAPVEVLLIDQNNYHTFLPLLYQVAAVELDPESIVYPIRGILRHLPNARFLMARVTGVDPERRCVYTQRGRFTYDYLILAAGSHTHYFGVPGAQERAFPLRTMAHAIRLRHHILRCFEHALWETDPQRRRQLLTFVIVGGGPTGVEFAAALAELIQGPLHRDFPELALREARVVLVEATDRLLGFLPPRLQTYARRRLEAMGVDVRLEAPVVRVDAAGVELRDGTYLPSSTVIWTAGVRGASAPQGWHLPTRKDGRIPVTATLQVAEFPEVFVVGDLAYCAPAGKGLPMVAPVAIQQGRHAARNLHRLLQGQEPLPFTYRDRGMMVVLGRNAAVAHLYNRWPLTGFPAWVLWLSLHLYQLIGFRNRLQVLLNWGWDYVFYERVARVILER